MGLGGLFKKQDQLTSFSNDLVVQAGKLKQDAANKEAAALRAQGDIVYRQTQEEKALFARDAENAAGQQEEHYLNGGVYLQGTPLAVTHETRRLAQFKLDTMEEQGSLAQDLFRSRADILEHSGFADFLQGQNSAVINSMQNDINKQQSTNSFYKSLFGGLATGGLSILTGLL